MRADVIRLGYAVRQKGIDPRIWCTGGRIVNEDGAVRWDVQLGWVVDVAVAGELFGSETRGRVLNSGFTTYPVPQDAEVLLGVAEGEPDHNTVVLGFVNNGDGSPALLTVTGLPVNGALEVSAAAFDAEAGSVSPYDTEMTNSPYSKREEYAGDHVDVAANQVLEAAGLTGQVRLASRVAEQAFLRGNDYTDAELAFLDGQRTMGQTHIITYEALATASVGPLAALKPFWVTLGNAWAQFVGTPAGFVSANGIVPVPEELSALGIFKAKIPTTLSQRIKGE